MQLMTTYKDNNYPIIINHNAISELNQLLCAYRDVVFIVDKMLKRLYQKNTTSFVFYPH